jgi:hypothetical protein
MDELGASKDVFRNYIEHGDSVLLANLIHITRHLLHSFTEGNLDLSRESLGIPPFISKLDILNTLPAPQHDFCNLWDSVVQQERKARAENNPFIEVILLEI